MLRALCTGYNTYASASGATAPLRHYCRGSIFGSLAIFLRTVCSMLITSALPPVPYLRGGNARPFLIIRAAVGAAPLQHGQVPSLRGGLARPFVPRASVGAAPLQHVQVPSPRGGRTRLFVPRTAVGAAPLQYVKVPSLRGGLTRPFVPRAAVGATPLHLQARVRDTKKTFALGNPARHISCSETQSTRAP